MKEEAKKFWDRIMSYIEKGKMTKFVEEEIWEMYDEQIKSGKLVTEEEWENMEVGAPVLVYKEMKRSDVWDMPGKYDLFAIIKDGYLREAKFDDIEDWALWVHIHEHWPTEVGIIRKRVK